MSSGELDLKSYYRSEYDNSGSHGSVMTAYNEMGEEYKMKLFESNDLDLDDEDESIPLEALREISILRLLRKDNGHPNIISIDDVKLPSQKEGEIIMEDGWGHQMGFVMPDYEHGNLAEAISMGSINTKEHKIQIANGLLNAIAYLHENGIIHRDIKAENVLLSFDETNNVTKPILIDFSFGKLISYQILTSNDDISSYDDDSIVYSTVDSVSSGLYDSVEDLDPKREMTHTPLNGDESSHYRAPEVLDQQAYSFPSDLWSVGILLLELESGQNLSSTHHSNIYDKVFDAINKISFDSNFGILLKGLLTENPNDRLTAKEALQSPYFSKKYPSSSPKVIQIDRALPLENKYLQRNPIGDSYKIVTPFHPQASIFQLDCTNHQPMPKTYQSDEVLEKRIRLIQKFENQLNCNHPLTMPAALTYSIQLEQLEEDIEKVNESQSLLDCVILASKFFEQDLIDLSQIEHDLKKKNRQFANWKKEVYINTENTIWMLMDFCLFPRHLMTTNFN